MDKKRENKSKENVVNHKPPGTSMDEKREAEDSTPAPAGKKTGSLPKKTNNLEKDDILDSLPSIGNNEDEDWTTITRRRRQRKTVVGTNGSSSNELSGLARKIHLHVWRFKKGTMKEELDKHLRDNLSVEAEIEELSAKVLNLYRSPTDSQKYRYGRERDCKLTDLGELRAFFGLLYKAGFLRNSKLNTCDRWSTDGTGVEFFRLVMSRKRFHFILQSLRFDDKATRNERKLLD
ncbi:hypothetical protein J437_LFUL018424 [Ladona fulva]|uniref:PiggyBac transposable element-derived protein domain-containing protein n=1 Tax=Ladona fulva TaxID=123851 RepID=A0A8K0KPG3_LADFU|nr:hypothetical protein J437_LFUL018424 [Ladona fulva]